ncbi:RNA exonuclease 1 homolog [Galleria mellonella]|uniref:RNA exonuclease 1 homolog n=1 Tax=Galleria mellonella TaxID=7137 RepID=A0A6J1WYE4_GALME|nr:RNA exonuclease 1 homolog [Galleria mellonella]
MLPSTGYFKGINCPFYDSGLCERPYCHFRHVKRESQNTVNEGMESGTILQKLVSAAVQKVLQHTDATTSTLGSSDDADDKIPNVQSGSKVTYNPTPIVELNKISSADTDNVEDVSEQRKRHIPVPYTPRKPVTLPIIRPVDSNGSSKPFIYIPPPVTYSPGSNDSPKLDPYTPKGTTTESKEKYLPGIEIELQEYTPKETTQQPNKHSYIPSDKSVSKKKILEYKPAKVNSKIAPPSVTYRPTPRSQVPYFSSDEDEPDKKKRKLSSDLNGLDDLGPEFDILDQILDEEKTEKDKNAKSEIDINKTEKNKDKNSKENTLGSEHCAKDERKKNEKKSHSKEKLDCKHKSTSHDKLKTECNNRSSEKANKKDEAKIENNSRCSEKSNKKDESKDDKNKGDKKEKYSSEKKKHSTRSSNESSKYSKSSERHSKHSSSSKNNSKSKDKSDHDKSHRRSKHSKEKHKKRKDKSPSVDLLENDNHNEENVDLSNEDIYDESDEDIIAMECKKIFEEYVPTEKPKVYEEIDNKVIDTDNEYVSSKKRISRTIEKNIKIIPKAPIKPDYKLSAVQTMTERLHKVREYHSSKTPSSTVENKIDITKGTFSSPNIGSSKIRIAHVPYVSTLLNAKKTITPSSNSVKTEPSTSSTVIQTVKKGAQRVAHIPNEKFIDRPGVLEPLASKIPANVRSTYLNMMIDECLKLYLSATDAYARAQHEELITSKKCSTVQIYKNSAVLAVSRLRKEFQECNGIKKSGSDCLTLQKIPQGAKTNYTGSWSIENKNRKSYDNLHEFSGAKLYNNIKKWILNEEQLKENGFPRPHPSGEKGRAIIIGQNKQKPPNGNIRTCCRCKKDYTVNKKGFAAVKEECIYHPNNKYRVRGEARYQCCSQDGTSDGCCIAPSHVYEYVDFENLKGYVRTMPPEKSMEDYGVYSLDCEMCYTTHGLDLTRVTVINSACKVVYETFIRPLHPIIDYNTRYSGITEEQMLEVKTTLLEVQATLLTMFNSKTILVGHSLESDFKALKLIHDTVIDTSILFPHKMGPPYKRALRNLSSEYLKKIIQNSVDGHDSAEDATVCMELIHFKLKEDLKTR